MALVCRVVAVVTVSRKNFGANATTQISALRSISWPEGHMNVSLSLQLIDLL